MKIVATYLRLQALAILGVAISSNAATLRGSVTRNRDSEGVIFPPISNGKNQAPTPIRWASASASSSNVGNGKAPPAPALAYVAGGGYEGREPSRERQTKMMLPPPSPTLAYVAGGGYGAKGKGTKTTYGAGRATGPSASSSADE